LAPTVVVPSDVGEEQGAHTAPRASGISCTHVIAAIADPSAGSAHAVIALSQALARIGVEVGIEAVEGWRRAEGPEMWLRAAGIPVRQHPQSAAGVPLLKALCLSEGLRRALSEASTSRRVFHTHGLWLKPNIYPAVIGRRRGIPVLHSVHGMLGDAALAFSRGKKRLFDMLFQRRALNHARCLHATSVLEYEDIRRYGLDNPVAIIPNGIEIPVLAPRSAKRADRVLLSLGRIHPKKGLDRLVRAWSVIEAAHPQWVLRLVGPAELGHDEELRALARFLGAKRIAIEPPLYGEAKLEAYREADLFVLPTRHENFALTVGEALAAGTPVISTKGAPWAGLETERCGWWIDHGVGPLVDALPRAMALPRRELQAMGGRGREWMRRDFGWDGIGAQMRDLYAWVLDSGPPPPTVRLD
jgi:glycosyltransferase involved in cell wall biosynthesis